MTDLDEIKRALAAATPGPWKVHPNPRYWVLFEDDWASDGWKGNRDNDAHLCAHAPAWLAELVERVERAEAALQEIATNAPDGSGWGNIARRALLEPESAS